MTDHPRPSLKRRLPERYTLTDVCMCVRVQTLISSGQGSQAGTAVHQDSKPRHFSLHGGQKGVIGSGLVAAACWGRRSELSEEGSGSLL